MKDINVHHYMNGNEETIDWRNMKFINRIPIGLALIFIGRFTIKWKKCNINISNTQSEAKKK